MRTLPAFLAAFMLKKTIAMSNGKCSLCDDGSEPWKNNANIFVPNSLCESASKDAFEEPSDLCHAFQAVGVYCGCENFEVDQNACRLCGEHEIMKNPEVVPDGISPPFTCMEWEFVANTGDRDCTMMQVSFRNKCCEGKPEGVKIVSGLDLGGKYCMDIADRGYDNRNKLKLAKCSGPRKSQLWEYSLYDRKLRPMEDPSKCVEVKELKEGRHLRLYDCRTSKGFLNWIYNEKEKSLSPLFGESLCVTNHGNSANEGDRLLLKECRRPADGLRDDFMWEFEL